MRIDAMRCNALLLYEITLLRCPSEGKKRSKGGGHVSEDSGEDLAGQAEKDALRSFAVDLSAMMPPVGGGGGKKRGGGKKKGKGKKK